MVPTSAARAASAPVVPAPFSSSPHAEKEELLPALLAFWLQHGWLKACKQMKFIVSRAEMAGATWHCPSWPCGRSWAGMVAATPGLSCSQLRPCGHLQHRDSPWQHSSAGSHWEGHQQPPIHSSKERKKGIACLFSFSNMSSQRC